MHLTTPLRQSADPAPTEGRGTSSLTGGGLPAPGPSAQSAVDATSGRSQKWRWWGAGALAVALIAVAIGVLSGPATEGLGANRSGAKFGTATLQSTAQQLFPGWTITADTSRPLTPTAVTGIAFAEDPSGMGRFAGVYLYRELGGLNDPSEVSARELWQSNAEGQFGEAYAWRTCRNLKILHPESITAMITDNLRDFGC